MPGLRERKRAELSSRIEQTALDLFERDGYSAVSVRDVAAASHISERTVFRYYPTKADLVFAVEDRWMAMYRSEADRLETEKLTVTELLIRISETISEFIENDPAPVLRAFDIIQGATELQAKQAGNQAVWNELVADSLDRYFATRRESLVVATAVMGMISHSVQTWGRSGGTAPLGEMITAGFETLAMAFAR